jgi:hypothetical protein
MSTRLLRYSIFKSYCLDYTARLFEEAGKHMGRIRGWGSLFALALPLLLWYIWSQLGTQTARINMERYSEWQSKEMPALRRDLTEFYLRNKRIAGPGDITLPQIPHNSGIQSWSIEPDTTITINLDAIIKGQPVRLHLVPVVRSASSIDYECVTNISQVDLRNVCYAEKMQRTMDIPAQLDANRQVVGNLPDIISSTGERLAADTPIGRVLVVPQDPADLNHCGYQCVKPKSCTSTRQIACSQLKREGNTSWFVIEASNVQVKGGSISTRSQADHICEEALGAGFKILMATSVTGTIHLDGGYEYWVHDDLRKENNCWSAE